MRMDQYRGLNDWSKNLVRRTVKVEEVGVRIFPDGSVKQFRTKRRMPVARKRTIGKIHRVYSDEPSVLARLYEYRFPNGDVYREYVQATPWSGGPVTFVALKDKHGNPVPESLWSQHDLDHC